MGRIFSLKFPFNTHRHIHQLVLCQHILLLDHNLNHNQRQRLVEQDQCHGVHHKHVKIPHLCAASQWISGFIAIKRYYLLDRVLKIHECIILFWVIGDKHEHK